MPQHLLATLATVCLVMPVLPALAQNNSDLRFSLPTKFETQFKNGALNLHGTILNATGQRFDCLELTFRLETENGVRIRTVSVNDLDPKERKDFSISMPPGKGVEHTATLPCDVPIVITDPVPGDTEPKPPVPQPPIDQTCTLVGQLNSAHGFSARFKEHPNGPTLTSVLDTAVLLINRKFAMSAPMDVQATTAYYEFPDVPLGMTFELALGDGWYFLSGKLPEARCLRAGTRQHISPAAVAHR